MKILNKILFPTNFGPTFDKDLENVLKICKKFDSELTLLHILPNATKWDTLVGQVRLKIEALMKKATLHAKTNFDVEINSQIEVGEYDEKIVEIADNKNVNLIILGAGNRKNKISQMGSNSEKIIRSSTIPVWIMEGTLPFTLDTILCPVDFSETSKKALDNSIHLARRFDSKLVVLHVIEPLEDYDRFDLDISAQKLKYENLESKEFDVFLNDFNFSDLNFEKKIKSGEANEVIEEELKISAADLLVMGSSGKKGLKRFFMGSVAEKVFRNINCSFIALKSKDFIQLELDREIDNIKGLYDSAIALVKDGFLKEALLQLDKCLEINEFYIKAWYGKSEIYEKLGDMEKSNYYEEAANKIQRSIWDKQIEADLRRQHSMFK